MRRITAVLGLCFAMVACDDGAKAPELPQTPDAATDQAAAAVFAADDERQRGGRPERPGPGTRPPSVECEDGLELNRICLIREAGVATALFIVQRDGSACHITRERVSTCGENSVSGSGFTATRNGSAWTITV